MGKCLACGSSDVVSGIRLNGLGEGRISLDVQGENWVANGENLLAEVCQTCGTVRTYVENPRRKWFKRS